LGHGSRALLRRRFDSDSPIGSKRAPLAWLFDIHRSCGLLIFALCAARLATRWHAGALADLVPSPSRYLRASAPCVHGFLYLLLISTSVLGWTLSSADDETSPLLLDNILAYLKTLNRGAVNKDMVDMTRDNVSYRDC
jgi:cytochrome b561